MSKCHSFSLKSGLRSIAMAQIQGLKYSWIMEVQNPGRPFCMEFACLTNSRALGLFWLPLTVQTHTC